MPFPTAFWVLAAILTVSGLVAALRYQLIRAIILIIAGLALGLASGAHLD